MVRRPAREALLQDVVFGRSKRLTKNGAAKKTTYDQTKTVLTCVTCTCC